MADNPNLQHPNAGGGDAQGRQQVRVSIDEREMSTSYTNAFRTHATVDEVFIDFGVNMIVPNPQQEAGNPDQPAGQLMLRFNDRIIANYKTVKRLAITLGQLVRAHEERFGEIRLEDAKGPDPSGN